MSGCLAIYFRELMILRKKFFRQLASMSVGPLLYLIAFGLGMGRDVQVHGRPYLEFLIPGLVAMNSMIQSFAIASEINIARFYWRIFEEFQAAPLRNIAYVTGEVMAGVTRA
ncbi:MAG: ABC transporter, partial [Acidobacteriota bacterium]